MNSITPVILCGGSGTRLWPRSRKAAPKPFLPLVGDRSLFEAALGRASDPAHFAPPLIVAGAVHLDLIERQLPQGSGARLVVEPAAKNTAPAIALAAQLLPEDAVMLVCPSDHYIADEAAFVAAALQAARLAREGWLVAFGIAPTRPETGYGYIRQGEELAGGYRIERFVEKPDLERAQAYLAEGTYCWNGGIFAFRAGTYLEELARHRPDMAAAVRDAVEQGSTDGARFHPADAPFAAITGDSVDYAVMELTDRAAMVSADMGWSDIGNWQSLREARASEADAAGNIARGPAELLDCRDVMVDSDGPRVSVVGLEDVIVVIDKGEVLVTSSRGAANVGKLKGASGQ
ncbi:mannose-1-phosphate guanylyltransferase [Altererythrobacter fulvus]|uniref:mannose-1-phosphate guanylyltransferase n=1 Tax=Caenibius fulvus TaxID=2126012 RepID=UPI003019A6CE